MRILCLTSMRASITNVRPEAEWFIGLQRGGATVTLMTEADTEYAQLARDAGLRIVDFQSNGKLDRRAITQIRDQLPQTDIVFAMTNKTIANAAFAVRGSNAKLVSYRGQTGNISRWDPSCYLTHLNPHVDAIVCVADAVRRSVSAQLTDPNKAITIYKGHDLAWYDVEAANLSAIGIDDTAPRVICVSNYRPRKGIETLIDAFAQLQSSAHLILVGTGTDHAKLARRALKHMDASRYHALGFRDDALAVTAAADIAVLPALRREGLPKTIIEAMACSVAPIVTDTGGNAELVIDGQCGLVVEPGSISALTKALQLLCDDTELRSQLGGKARERIGKDFRIQDTIQKTLSLFGTLLGKTNDQSSR
ncbi:MAG: glycosyltransferase family 4 protein [Gammaproteobacteria bacterium]|nr:glycosyltransferase family 4 protein [Gammaproteobacteria bacterium]